MNTYIILLRGVTPKGKNKVPMADLREKLSESGLNDVSTYIQSGNVIANSELSASNIEKLVHDTIQKNFGGDLVIIAKKPTEFKKIIKKNPCAEADTKKLYYTMMASEPEAELLKEFEAIDFTPDKITVVDDIIYTCYDTKLSNSKFHNNWFERKLKVASTTRNYNTMTKLMALVSHE